MSIIVKGFDIPKCCYKCGMCLPHSLGGSHSTFMCSLIGKQIPNKKVGIKRLNECPLEEVADEEEGEG